MQSARSTYRTALEDFARIALSLTAATAVRIETPEGSGQIGTAFDTPPIAILFGEGGSLTLYEATGDVTLLDPLIRRVETAQQDFREKSAGFEETDRANEIARSATGRFEALFESLPIACYACDVEGRLVEWNRAAEEIWGAGLEMAWGKDAASTLDPHDPPTERALLARALAGETVRDGERELVLRDGEVRYHLAYAFPLRDGENIIGAMGVRLDISRRRAAQRALAEREALYRTVLETLAEGLILVDEKGEVVLRNASAEAILRIGSGEIDLAQAFPPESVTDSEGRSQPPENWPLSIALRTGRPARNVLLGILRPEIEQRLWIRINAAPVFREGSPRPIGAVATFREVDAPAP